MNKQQLLEELAAARKQVSILEDSAQRHKHIEEALRESEEKYHTHFSLTNDVIYVLDDHFKVTSVSPSVGNVLGYKPEAFIGKHFYDLSVLHEDDLGKAAADADRVLSGEKISSAIYRFITSEGEIKYGEVSGVPIIKNDQTVGIVSVARDITKRKLAEDELREHKDHLEALVKERMSDLTKMNEQLTEEIEWRKRMESAQRESEEKYRILVENANEAILLVQDGMFQFVNPKTVDLVGYSIEELTSKAFDFFIHPEDREMVLDKYEKRMHGETVPDIYSARVRDKEGNNKWVEINAILVPWNGRWGVLAFLNDITKRKLAEDALRESEAKYRAVVDAFDGLIYVCSQDYRIQFMNQNLIDRTGYDGTGELCYKVLHNLDHICSWCVNERVWKGETVRWEIESPKDQRWYYSSNSPIFHPDGTMSKQALILDITERKLAEEALHKSEAKYRLLTEKMNDVIGMMDLNLKLIYVSPSIEKISGFSPEECTLLDPSEMMTPESLARVVEVMSEVLEQEQREGVDLQRTVKLELEYFHKNGTTIWMETIASLVRDDTGKIVGIHGVSRDITERKKAEEEKTNLLAELERSNKDLAHFADVVSHDLQEPLRVVSGFIQLLSRRYGDKLDEKARDYINFAVQGSNRMQKMIQDLLSYSRVVTKKKTYVLADTTSVLDEVKANLHLAIKESGASIIEDSLPSVMADPTQLMQLFQNLIGNAIKFRRDEPLCIHISADKVEDEWVFSVKDNGIGIEPKYFERIFGLFERLHTWEKYQGSGVGLALCKRIVQQFGGRIWVDSIPGKGTTFYFSIKG